MKLHQKLIALTILLGGLSLPFTAFALPVAWDRYVSGTGGGVRELYNSGTDHVLIGGTATTTNSQLEVQGTISATTLRGVTDPLLFSGSDEGAQVNTVYAAGASSGVAVLMTPTSFSTQISATTNNKFLRIICPIGGGADNNGNDQGNELRFTGTVGTSTLFNTNNYIGGNVSGMDGCNLVGTNGTTARNTTGVDFDGSNGGFTGSVTRTNISGFGIGIALRPNTSFNIIDQSAIHFNGTNVSEPDTSGANCENMRITNSVLADSNWQNGGGFTTDYKGMYVQESGNCQWTIAQTSLDDNQLYIDQFGGTANIWNLIGDHFENPNKHTYVMIQGNPNTGDVINTVTNLIGGDMMNDVVAGQPAQIQESGFINLLGFTSDGNGGNTGNVTRIINATASTTFPTWVGLVCKGANKTSFVYGNIPCSPFGVGSDIGQPSIYVASTSVANGIGIVDIATSTTNLSVPNPAVLNIGPNPKSGAASTTINMNTLQFQGKNAAGTVSCMFVVGTTVTVVNTPCNN